MLSKEQLQDAAKCMGKICDECKMGEIENAGGSICIEEASKAALELIEENEKLKEILTGYVGEIISGDGIPCKGIFGHEEDMK